MGVSGGQSTLNEFNSALTLRGLAQGAATEHLCSDE